MSTRLNLILLKSQSFGENMKMAISSSRAMWQLGTEVTTKRWFRNTKWSKMTKIKFLVCKTVWKMITDQQTFQTCSNFWKFDLKMENANFGENDLTKATSVRINYGNWKNRLELEVLNFWLWDNSRSFSVKSKFVPNRKKIIFQAWIFI